MRPDSGGAGRQRGGLGAELVVRALAPLAVNTTIERVHCKPWGLDGGGDGAGNAVAVREGGRWDDTLPNAKLFTRRLRAGDAFMTRSGGGGGFGDPCERDPAQVADDVVEGYVTEAAAAALYGVVLDPATGQPDIPATLSRRAALRQSVAAD